MHSCRGGLFNDSPRARQVPRNEIVLLSGKKNRIYRSYGRHQYILVVLFNIWVDGKLSTWTGSARVFRMVPRLVDAGGGKSK